MTTRTVDETIEISDIDLPDVTRFIEQYGYENGRMVPTREAVASAPLVAGAAAYHKLARLTDQARAAMSTTADSLLSAAHGLDGAYEGNAVGALDTWWLGEGMARHLQVGTLLDVAAELLRGMAFSAHSHAERVNPREEG